MTMDKSMLFFLFFLSGFASAHFDDAYNHWPSIPASFENKSWMKRLSDKERIDRISIPGTHDSASFYGGDIIETQSASITAQLNAGVRFLDIRLKHISNVFAIHHGPFFQKQFFGDVLNQVVCFLQENPTEFVLLRVKKEQRDENSTRDFEDTFADYVNKYSDVIFQSRGHCYFPSVSEARGKIIFLDETTTSGKYPPFGIKYPQEFNIQDEYKVSSNWGLYGKWEKVKRKLEQSSGGERKTINFLSASHGSFPYFIASGHSSNGTSAPRLATGLTTPAWNNTYPDFPRVNCFIGICTIAFEGTNTLTKDWILKNNPVYTGGIVADFIGGGLIDAVINSNFR